MKKILFVLLLFVATSKAFSQNATATISTENSKSNFQSSDWGYITTRNDVEFYGRWTHADGTATWHIKVVNKNAEKKYVGVSFIEFYDAQGNLVRRSNGGGSNVGANSEDEDWNWWQCEGRPASGSLKGITVKDAL